jgi:beta-galactosidase
LGQPVGDPTKANYDDGKWDVVSLPHSHEIFDANLDGFKEHGRNVGWYRRGLEVPVDWLARKVFLEFKGAMEATTVWVNGNPAGSYAVSGFDSFDFDISPLLRAGRNVITVEVDNRVNPQIPPDGEQMDYVLFGGLYRDVFLHVTDQIHVTFPWEAQQAGVRLMFPEISEKAVVVQAESTVKNESSATCVCSLVTEIRDRDGKTITTIHEEREIPARTPATFSQRSEPISNPHLWSPETPYLYRVLTIVRENNRELDRVETAMGIRWVRFDEQKGFFLNGQHLKLIGVNCHQTWPFIGGAVPDGLHRRDAEQIKAMGVNWVRLSHYPQDPDFLDALDELGLMALEEPPTWQKPGNEEWMANLGKSFRSMIRRDRNHPSIVIWGACINHGGAEPSLVQAAKEEDPTRDRGQDTVPTPMNFQPYRISGHGALSVEHTGHTFPTKRGSRATLTPVSTGGQTRLEKDVNREFDQARRHWEQINSAYLRQDNSGLAVWCMYDYNTLYNTNEAGMVWHGVCDIFRIPKYSFWWHMSELTTKPMAYVVRIDGAHVAVFSNCEQIRLWEDDGQGYGELATQGPDEDFTAETGHRMKYALRHPPFHFTIRPAAIAIKAAGLISNVVEATYEFKKAGLPVALRLEADRPTIFADGADLSRIIATAVDGNGTPVDACESLITFDCRGLGQLIGENPVHLRAGKMIVLAQSGFIPGELSVSVSGEGLAGDKVTVRMNPVPSSMDVPNDLPTQQPTKRMPVGSGK